MLDDISGKRDYTSTLKNRGNKNVRLCWKKMDNKAKKVNFLVSQFSKDMSKKATLETVEDLAVQIERLQT